MTKHSILFNQERINPRPSNNRVVMLLVVLFQISCSDINNSRRGLFQVLHNESWPTPFILTVIVVCIMEREIDRLYGRINTVGE